MASATTRNLSGHVAIITGAAQGIGKAFATAFLRRNGKVMIGDLSREKGQQTCQDLQREFGRSNAAFYHVDVTNPANLEELYRTTLSVFKRLDVVVNNAGVGFEVENSPANMWRKTIDINLTAVIDSTYLAKKYMEDEGEHGGRGGIVVNIASMGGLQAMPFSSTYAASKAGVIGFTRSTQYWPAQSGVSVYAICPGFVSTAMLQSGLENQEFSEAVKAGGIVKVERVAEGFIRLLDERPDSGSCMRVTVQRGIDYQKFHRPAKTSKL